MAGEDSRMAGDKNDTPPASAAGSVSEGDDEDQEQPIAVHAPDMGPAQHGARYLKQATGRTMWDAKTNTGGVTASGQK